MSFILFDYHSIAELEDLVHRVYEASSAAGAYMSQERVKIKVMKIIRSPVVREQDHMIINGQEVENVKNFFALEQ